MGKKKSMGAVRIQKGSPKFYGQRAKDMLEQAEKAHTLEARSELLKLAENWELLAKKIEHSKW